MSETAKNRAVLKKSYEIAYALFRVATNMEEKDLAQNLKSAGGNILASIANDDHDKASRSIAGLEWLVTFAKDINAMGVANADILLQELYDLNVAIAELNNAAKGKDVDLSDIFPKLPEVDEAAPHEETASAVSGILKSANRQTAIMERIRQTGNCRLKDIQEILPECSERTIRYDLQSLLEQNLIERIGNGGPAVYYRVRQTVEG